MAKTAIREHVYIGSMKVGRGIPNLTLQYKVQEILANPLKLTLNDSKDTAKQISQLRVEYLWNAKPAMATPARVIVKKPSTKH